MIKILPGMPDTIFWQFSPIVFLIITIIVAYFIYKAISSREQGN